MGGERLGTALRYAKRGFYIIPVGPDKHPKGDNGLSRATKDPKQIRRWWRRWPDANVGVATKPSGLTVIDVDVKDGAPGLENWRDILEELGGDIENTVITETPSGGLHLWYRSNGYNFKNKDLAEGINVKAAGGEHGGYVLAPPSTTPTGDYHFAMDYGLDEREVAALPEGLAALLTERNEQRAEPVDGPIPDGERNSTLTSLAGSMRHRGLSQGVIESALLEANRDRCTPPLPEQEVCNIAKSVSRYEPGNNPEHCTDLGNARRLVRRYGQDLRYCDPLGGWLVWDGKRWAPDDTGAVKRMAKETVLSIYREAADAGDPDRRQRLAKWATRSEQASRITAMINLAATELEVVARPEEFDTAPWLLNVQNGTLDLRTGELREHRREHLITKLAPVEYDPIATAPVWDKYLADTTKGNDDFAVYLQQACGYTLTGVTDEEDVFLVLGPAATGKSTLVEAMLRMLGDYGVKASFDTFLVQRNIGGPRPDLVRLRGARMAAAVEPTRRRGLDESLVKELTGGDTISVRALYSSPFEYRPKYKLWLAANHCPKLSDDDSGIWRRLKRLPFEHEIPEHKQDPEVKRHLCSPEGGRALLAWAMEGCLAWQEQGLKSCDIVRQKTLELRADMNPIGEFLDMCCVLGADAETPARELREAYEEWAKDFGAKPINNRAWGERLRAMGCYSRRKRRGDSRIAVWYGIGLLDDDAPEWTEWTVRTQGFTKVSP